MERPRNLLRLLGVAVIWGVLWAVLVLIVGTIVGIIDPADIDPGEEPVALAPVIGLAGFLCGAVFGALVFMAERGASVLDVPLMRVVPWGMLVAVALPLVTGKGIPEMLVTGPLGALSAIVSVALMRRYEALPVTR